MLVWPGDKEYRQLEAGIFRVKPGDKFGFRFGKIERHAVGLRDRSHEEAEEPQNLRPHRSSQRLPLLRMVRLRIDDVAQIETSREQENSDNGHGQRELVGFTISF